MKDFTYVWIRKDIAKALKDRRLTPNESYNNIIKRLLEKEEVTK